MKHIKEFINNPLNKKVILIFILCFSIFIVTGILYLFANTKSLLLKTDLTCNFRDEVYISDFIYKLDGTLQNNYQIDTTTVGAKKVKAIYKDSYGFYKVKIFTIEIKDVTSPTILVNDTFTVNVGYENKLEDVILCADDYDDGIKCNITGSYNLEEPGDYQLTISATDNSNNTTTKEFTLSVVEPSTNNSSSNEETTYVDYTQIYNKYKNNSTLIGLDISKWQENVDFTQLKENNVEFVILKLGGQSEIDSDITIDPYFENNYKKAKENNIQVGVYFYSHAKTIKEAKEQAQYVIKKLEDYDIDLFVAFDWENWDNYNNYGISLNTLNNIAQTFLTELQSEDYDAFLYSSEYYLDTIWFSEDYNNIWLANYGTINYQGNYSIWQLCSDGKIEGINTYVDIDIMYLN